MTESDAAARELLAARRKMTAIERESVRLVRRLRLVAHVGDRRAIRRLQARRAALDRLLAEARASARMEAL